MNLSPNETIMIDEYLAAVGKRLSADEREETLAGLRSHIHEAIAARSEEGPGIVEAVLAEMDSPDQYGSPESVSGGERFCKLALIGVLLLPWGLPILWHAVRLTPSGESMKPVAFYEHPFYQFVFLPLGLLSMVVATVLGWQSMKRIANSRGSLIGLSLAALDAVFYPLLILNLILFIAFSNVMDIAEFAIASFLILPPVLLLIIGNIYVYRLVLKSARFGKSLWRRLVIPALLYLLVFVGLVTWFSREADRLTEQSRKEFERYINGSEKVLDRMKESPDSSSDEDVEEL